MIGQSGLLTIGQMRRGKMQNNNNWKGILVLILLVSIASFVLAAVPTGPQINITGIENGTSRSATILNTTGGTITTIVLNATTQNPHWKAYVGNVTGKLVLEDASNYSIYEWSISTVAGEVYVTRSSTTINWDSIVCANSSHVSQEETAMNHTSSADDSISNTFTRTTHQSFWTGSVEFNEDVCDYTLITYINDTPQTTTENFQEILLWDGTYIVYTTIIENTTLGFDIGYYDFQMLVPEKGWEGPVSSTAYYFYVELV